MVKLLTTSFYVILVSASLAQLPSVDSLKEQLQQHSSNDTIRVNLYNSLSFQYQWISFDTSLMYANRAREIAEKINFQRGVATASFRQAHCLWALGDSDRAIEKGLRAVRIAEENNFVDVKAESYRILAISYRDQQEIGKAVWYIRTAEALALQEKKWDLLARVYNLAGVIECTRNKNDSARIYFDKSLDITAKHSITKFHVSQALSNIGELYLPGNPDEALRYFDEALESAKQTHNRSAQAGIMADIGRAYIIKKRYRDANEYLKKSLALARELGLKRVIRHAYMALAELNMEQGNTTAGLSYMQSYYDVRDSLLNGSKTRQIVELETRFESEKQQQKIQLLEQEKKIQSLWTNVLVVGSIMLMIGLIIIYDLHKQRSAKARQLLDTQRALTEKLKETDMLKSRFFANLSHEFRTPLSLIMGPIEEQLRKSKLTEDRKSLTIVKRNAQRLLGLVNQLLDLSKLDAGKMDLEITPGKLMEFAELLTASFDSVAEQKQIHFVKNISTKESVVGFDADKVEKIVSNILFNAFKFTGPNGRVTFSMYRDSDQGNKVVISVADTGRGIPVEEQSNIFSPFYQLKYDSEDNHPGTGLGLSLVNELVKLYDGTIRLVSEPGKGTCITVVLPLFHLSEDPVNFHRYDVTMSGLLDTAESDDKDQRDLVLEKAYRILVVEDNTALQNFIASGFSKKFTILKANDGMEGLKLAKEYVPDVIISDVMMPLMNGVEFIQNIKKDERTSHIPVILLTAKADDASKINGLLNGADEYLAKPFSMEELQLRVNNLVLQRKRLAARLKMNFANHSIEKAEASLDDQFLLKVRSVVEKNIGNSFFSVEMLAEEVNLSRAQLFRKLKALVNTSPRELINDIRLQRAAQLIRAKSDNVSRIGFAVGFSEQSYFSKRFRKKYGVSPSEYAD